MARDPFQQKAIDQRYIDNRAKAQRGQQMVFNAFKRGAQIELNGLRNNNASGFTVERSKGVDTSGELDHSQSVPFTPPSPPSRNWLPVVIGLAVAIPAACAAMLAVPATGVWYVPIGVGLVAGTLAYSVISSGWFWDLIGGLFRLALLLAVTFGILYVVTHLK